MYHNLMAEVYSDWKQLDLRLIFAYDGPVGKWYMPMYSLPHYSLWLLRTGSVTIRSEKGDRFDAAGDDWVLVPPNYMRTHEFDPASRILSMHFVASWGGGQPIFPTGKVLVRSYDGWSDLEPLTSALAERRPVVKERKSAVMTLPQCARLQAALNVWFARWHELMSDEGIPGDQAPEIDHRVDAAIERLNECSYAGTVPYDELQEVTHLSRVHLDRLFVEKLGRSPKRYMEERCLRHVCELLLTTSMPVKAICFSCGFATAAHFSNWFRRKTGRTPLEYRRSNV